MAMWRLAAAIWLLGIVTGGRKIDGPAIGIDLGTTYARVGIYVNDHVEVIPTDVGDRVMPAYVAFMEGERLVGEAALRQAISNPSKTVFGVKRWIGRRMQDLAVQEELQHVPYDIIDQQGMPWLQVTAKGHKRLMPPEQILSMILRKLRQTAEQYVGRQVLHAVITVPAGFNDAQRQSTKDAAAIAGLNVLQIVAEPTAAAVAYGLGTKDERHILVYDLGGGTFDASVLLIEDGVFEVLATAGDTHLGGEDFDRSMTEHLMQAFQRKHGTDMTKDMYAVQKLRGEAEKAKCALSSAYQTRIEIEALFGGIDFNETLTRTEFEGVNSRFFQRTVALVERGLRDAGVSRTQIHDVVLVGGSAQIPKVQHLITEFFGGKESMGGAAASDAVVRGAAILAGALSGGQPDLVVIEVAPLTLGVATAGGIMTQIINRNTAIPTKKSRIFSTDHDHQQVIVIDVFEGEQAEATDNRLLGRFKVEGVAPAPRGYPQIEVQFEVDSDGILDLQVYDRGGCCVHYVTMTKEQRGLSHEQIDMIYNEDLHCTDKERTVQGCENAIV